MSRKKRLLSCLCVILCFVGILLFLFFQEKIEDYENLDVALIGTDRELCFSLAELEEKSDLIIEATVYDVLGQEAFGSYDYEFERMLPSGGYTQREIKADKVYKGDIAVNDSLTLTHWYCIWEYPDGTKQLISSSRLRPLKRGSKYLMFLKYNESFKGYDPVCDYQGLYPLPAKTASATDNSETIDLSHMYPIEELYTILPLTKEVHKKYFKLS